MDVLVVEVADCVADSSDGGDNDGECDSGVDDGGGDGDVDVVVDGGVSIGKDDEGCWSKSRQSRYR